MHMDDLISSLKFLNRCQLLQFCRANRLTFSIIENHFAEWPAIYSEFSIVHKSKTNDNSLSCKNINDGRPSIDSFLELKGLNAIVNNNFRLTSTNCGLIKWWSNVNAKEKNIAIQQGSSSRMANISSLKQGCHNTGWHPWLEAHKDCKEDWHQIENPASIPQFRRGYLNEFIKIYFTHESPDKCCQFFSHKVHDQQSRNSIVKDYILQHRLQNFAPAYDFANYDMDMDADAERVIFGDDEEVAPLKVCPTALLLPTTNVNKMISHLKMNFVKIYKLYIKQIPEFCFCYYGDENENGECQQNYESNEAMCLKILQWIIENGKITNGISCVVDVHLIDELLGILGGNGNEQMNQQILLNSIGKCGHVQLISNEANGPNWKNLMVLSNPKLKEMLLKNSLMVTIGSTILIQSLLTIKNLLKIYNPQGNHRRLIWICQDKYASSIVDYLIESFLNSKNPNTYFLLIDAHFERKKFKQKYYNEKTKEYLRVQAAYRYSISDPMDVVEVYLARYSKLSTIAEEEFESFFDRVDQNVEKRMRLCEAEIESKNLEKDNYGTWAIVPGEINILDPADEDAEIICSFSSFLAKVFPAFSLNIGNRAASNGSDAEELYNAGYVSFRRAFLPPHYQYK